MITTHRLFFMKGKHAIDIPLYYIKLLKEAGGILKKNKIEIFLDESKIECEYPPYVTDYYVNFKKTFPPDF